MRGEPVESAGLFSYITPEKRVPAGHPLRPIRKMVDEALKKLSPRFSRLYSRYGRPSIPPEQLVRALLLQVLYTIRSERQLMEQLEYNLLYRWFVGLGMDESLWDVTVFSKNRDRLLQGDIAAAFFKEIVKQAREQELISEEHFSVDGTLLEAWASQKSFQKKDENADPSDDDPSNPMVNFRGERRKNDTHRSTTDPDSRLFRKGPGREAKLSYLGHAVAENRNGILVSVQATLAHGRAEREAALELVKPLTKDGTRITLGGDKGYDTFEFVESLREMGVTPHLARKTHSALDRRTTRHEGYEVSQRKRKQIEEPFGWMKTVGLLDKLRHRGLPLVNWVFTFTSAAYNLVRMRNLMAATA
ncbi:MAG: IS5 family transposase [Vicinamibacteria bacterium]